VHIKRNSSKFIVTNGVRYLIIPPYSPQLNAEDNIIANVKQKFWRRWLNGKEFNLTAMQDIVDEIGEEACKGCIRASEVEIDCKLKLSIS
jgi:hypothetical protein